MLETILMMASVIAPVTLGVVEAVKQATGLRKSLPLIAVGIGLALGAVATFFVDVDLAARLWAGGISGLAASGLFDFGRSVQESIKDVKGDE